MKLHIENFGPIKKGEIDLTKRFYTFVGYNNSGKTYMSQLLWSVMNKTNNSNWLSDLEINEDTDNKNFILFDNLPELISEMLKVSSEDKIIGNINFIFSELNEAIRKVEFSGIKKAYSVVHRGGTKVENIKPRYAHILTKEKGKLEFRVEKVYRNDDKMNKEYDEIDETKNSLSPHIVFRRWLKKYIPELEYLEKYEQYFFLPANRVFFPTYYKEIYQSEKNNRELAYKELQQNSNPSKLRDLLKPNSTQAVDKLTHKIFFEKYVETNHYPDLVKDLEKIMGGKIAVRQAEGIAPPEFQFEMNDEAKSKLDLYLASSSVNQLTTLYLYLKYWASESNNFLFIDEPEENLHPSNQIALVNLLMKFANRNNNRVLISTHSSFVAEMVNNYAQIAYLQEEGKDVKEMIDKNKLNIQPVENLKHTDFGVYFFNGETMREYEVKEHGAFFEDFHKEQRKVQDMSYVLNDAIYKILDPEE